MRLTDHLSDELAKVEHNDCARCDNKREFNIMTFKRKNVQGNPVWMMGTIPCPSCTETVRLKDLRERAAKTVEDLYPCTAHGVLASAVRALPL